MPATGSSATLARLRADIWKFLSNSPSTTKALPILSRPNCLASAPVLISLLLASSSTTIWPSLALAESACLRPSAFTFLGRSNSWLCATGPIALAPPTNSGAERAPWRAWPVPFCLYIFFLVRLISARVSTLCWPERRLANCHTTTRWIRSARGSRPKMASLSSTSPADLLSRLRTLVFISALALFFGRGRRGRSSSIFALLHGSEHRQILVRLLDGVAHHHPAALGARHRAAHHDQAALDIDLGHFQILGGDIVDAIMAVHLLVLEGLARVLTTAGTAQRAVADRDAVRGFETAEIPALHRAGEAAADGDAGDVHLLAGNEVIGLKLIAHFQQVRAIDTKLCHLAARFEFGLGELAASGLGSVLDLGKTRTELDGGVAVLLIRAGRHDGAAVELQDRDRDMGTVCQKQTGHAHLLRDDACAHLTLLTT